MRTLHLLPLGLLAFTLNAQQVDWLNGPLVDFTLNPGMSRHTIASAPGMLVTARLLDVSAIYGNAVFGSVALELLDPASGDTWLSCVLSDSVSITAAAVNPAGIAYFSGSFLGNAIRFCNNSELPGLGGAFTENHFVMAWNLNTGMPYWSRNLSESYPDIFEVPALAVDPDGFLWYAATEFMDGSLVKVDFFGEELEVRPVANIRRFGTISFDPWGGLYASGSCEDGVLTFGGQGFVVESNESYNMFVLRYKPDGTPGFARFGADVTFTHPTVVATSDGYAYLAGDLHLAGEVWPGLQFEGSNWGSDVFIAKLDSTGQFLWGVETLPQDAGIIGDVERAQGPCIAVDVDNRVYFAGTNRGVVDWGNGVLSQGQIPNRGLTVVAFAEDGSARWAATSTPATWFATAQGIAATAEADAVHLAGHLAGNFSMGAFTAGTENGQHAVFARIADMSTGINSTNGTSVLHAWPNPAAGLLFVEWNGPVYAPCDLHNSSGQWVRSTTLIPGMNTVDLEGLTPGLYLLRTAFGDALRVVVE